MPILPPPAFLVCLLTPPPWPKRGQSPTIPCEVYTESGVFLVCLSHVDKCEASGWASRPSRLFILTSLSTERGKHTLPLCFIVPMKY